MTVGIDIGGTFTDLVVREPGGEMLRLKVASTPRDPEAGALAALDAAFALGVEASRIERLAHASTIATNALLGQMHLELARVAFVTTAGFRDVLEIGRQNRSSVYDLHVERPVPLAKREDRFVVHERREADGSASTPLDLAEVDRIAAEIARRGIVSVAIGLLHADVDDTHERAIAERLKGILPEIDISRSAELVCEFREYERFSTAVVNAALMPIVRGYLARFERGLRERDVRAPLFVMRSDGGMASAAVAARRPASLIESGPASGVIAAAALARTMGIERVLSFDMGGTTAKAGTIVHGAPEIAHEFEAAGATHSGRALRGSGYPVRFPFVDLAEVSAGGGTIAWLDRAGMPHVGPQSAGADPGPAAYGRGDRPTVTDADVVLGRLNPRALLGGSFPIDAVRARRAIETISGAFSGDAMRAAAGILALVDFEMAKVLRIVSVERGYDPRDFTLVAFGGGGPLHACALASEIGVRRVIVPPLPGLFSAVGLLDADVRETVTRTYVAAADASAWSRLGIMFDELAARAERALAEQDVPRTRRSYVREVDLRYAGQSFSLPVPYGTLAATCVAFHALHERRYGYAARDEALELVTVRVIAVGSRSAATMSDPLDRTRDATEAEAEARVETRDVWNGVDLVATHVYDRARLGPGTVLHGPAIVEQYDTTTYVAPAWSATVDASRNLLLASDAA